MPASLPAPVQLGSSLRECAAADTLARALPLMPALGISRVSDITRMDRLGLPVYASIRPWGRALCVHAGKGVRPAEAEVGALMEAVEFAAAEPARSAWARATPSVAELVSQLPAGLRLVDFAPLYGRRVEATQQVGSVACEWLGHTRPVLVPAELVFVPCTEPGQAPLFGWSSNGLASGNSVAEATLHALLEVLERDTLAMNRAADVSAAVDVATLPEPFCSLAAQWRALGIELGVRWLPNDLGLPCFAAWLHEPDNGNVNLAGGSGLHLQAPIALARAVCEAAQSRLSLIHGGRDDITGFYEKYRLQPATERRSMESEVLARIFGRSRTRAWPDLPPGWAPAGPLPAVLDGLLSRLRDSGFDTVFRHRFDVALNGLSVVKVIVPRCENTEHGSRRVGPRLLAHAVAHA